MHFQMSQIGRAISATYAKAQNQLLTKIVPNVTGNSQGNKQACLSGIRFYLKQKYI